MIVADLLTDQFIIDAHSDGLFVSYNSVAEYKHKIKQDLTKYKTEILAGIKRLIKQVPLLIDYKFCISLSRGEVQNLNADATKMTIYNERKRNIKEKRIEEAIPTKVYWMHKDNIVRQFDVREQHCETVSNFISAVVIPILTVSFLQLEKHGPQRDEILSYNLQYFYN
jgi:hypothetical protein